MTYFLIGTILWLWIVGAYVIYNYSIITYKLGEQFGVEEFTSKEKDNPIFKIVVLIFWPFIGTLTIFRD